MWICHTTSTPSTSTSAGFIGLRGHISSPPYTDDAIDDDSEEDVIEDVYDAATRGRHNQSEPRYRDTW
jgi:hypothetical protein